MKNYSIIVLLLLIYSCHTKAQARKELEVPEFEKAIADNSIQLLDVRTASEYNSGHLKNSMQADWTDKNQFLDRTQYLDKNKPLFVYCLSGARSAAAADWFRKQGFQAVYELKGGISSWKTQGKPLVGATNTPQMTSSEYHSLINSHTTILVDFGAEWCPPCKKMEPVLNELQQEYGSHYKLVKVNGGTDTEVMKANSVESLPVFIIYKNGKEVWRKQGVVSKEELKKNL
jgi:thioredoxin